MFLVRYEGEVTLSSVGPSLALYIRGGGSVRAKEACLQYHSLVKNCETL